MGDYMSNTIDGLCFKNMVDYAVRNLNKHVKHVNQLNVFPVPDGDTGTNMVTTIHKGISAVGESVVDLPSVSKKFARSVGFEARGNSGVIVSQFLKGLSEKFYNVDVADGKLFISALENGVKYAYSSVATPVEGTMLTVLKDATNAAKAEYTDNQSIKDIIDCFLNNAKISLENTPELLSVLKDSGVVDSGGAGVVYLFEGIKRYLDGDSIDDVVEEGESTVVDYDTFNKDSSFDFGYCTEMLVQLLNYRDDFDYNTVKENLSNLGNSLVLSQENDKVRIHIHTKHPEKVFEYMHKFGEFLTSKIENMTVQHTEINKKFLYSDNVNNGAFSIVAVAYDPFIQKLFIDMGADVSVFCEENISTKDYLDAFESSNTENLIVFPNSSDAILSAVQAKKLYSKSRVYVINSRGIAECYAALPTIDFEEENIERTIDNITQVINNLYVVSVAKRNNSIRYANKEISRNEYYSFSGKELFVINKSLVETAAQTIKNVINDKQKEIVTIFYKSSVTKSQIDAIIDVVSSDGIYAEFFTVQTESLPCELSISFE